MSSPSMSCPSGGNFWACGDGSHFVGCCGVNPCGSQGCAAGNLVTTSFPASQYASSEMPDEQCEAGKFYTCTTGTPFWGCCKSNPCGGSGCPSSDLAGAFLSNNANIGNPYLEAYNASYASANSPSVASTVVLSAMSLTTTHSASSVTSSTPSSTQSSASTTGSTLSASLSATAASATTTSSAPTVAAAQSSSSNAGAIAGGVVGGLAVLAALILGMVYLLRRRNKNDSPPASHGQIEVQQDVPPMVKVPDAKYASPTLYSSPSSPQPPYSPSPPSYTTETHRAGHISYELPANQQFEMDSGQMYHPYRTERGSGAV